MLPVSGKAGDTQQWEFQFLTAESLSRGLRKEKGLQRLAAKQNLAGSGRDYFPVKADVKPPCVVRSI